MSQHADILQRLSDLSAADRQWICERLSSAARKALLNGVSEEPPPVVRPEPTVLQASIYKVEAAPVAAVRTALGREPTWITHVLLQFHPWPWHHELAAGHSAWVRGELAKLQAKRQRYAPQLCELLIVGLAEQLPDLLVSAPDVAAPTRRSPLSAMSALARTLSARRSRLSA
jgi:hypothetical protein